MLFAAAICLLTSAAANAQSYAITNAKIVTVSGVTIDKGTVVIRNGLIDSVGATVTPPADATVIDAGGATVYPGLIDTLTNLGIPARPTTAGGPGGQTAAAAATPVSNSNYTAGLRPEDMTENEVNASAGLAYRLWNNVSMDAQYSYTLLSSGDELRDYDRNRVSLGLSAQF